MKDIERAAIAITLLEYLNRKQSRFNQVALQRSAYLLQELAHVPLGLHFMLYKHTVHSFDLADEIMSLTNTVFRLQPKEDGALVLPNDRSGYVDSLKATYQDLIERYRPQIEFLADEIADTPLKEIDLLATTLYVNLQTDFSSEEGEKVQRIRSLKKTVDETTARKAISDIERLMKQTARFNGHNNGSR